MGTIVLNGLNVGVSVGIGVRVGDGVDVNCVTDTAGSGNFFGCGGAGLHEENNQKKNKLKDSKRFILRTLVNCYLETGVILKFNPLISYTG